MERLDAGTEALPQFSANLVTQVAVIEVRLPVQLRRSAQIGGKSRRLRLMPGEEPERFHVEEEALRRSIGPNLRRALGWKGVVGAVDLD